MFIFFNVPIHICIIYFLVIIFSRLGKINLLSPALLSGLFLSSNEKKELEIAKKKLANEDPLILLLKHAKLSEKKQNLDDAINYYHEALVLLQVKTILCTLVLFSQFKLQNLQPKIEDCKMYKGM